MANMSYCRFQNTLSDLRDCEEALSDIGCLAEIQESDLSDEEKRAAKRLIDICIRVAKAYEDDESED